MEDTDVLQQEDRMHQAIKENNLAAVEACVEERWPLDRMSFVLACVRGHQDIVDKLLRYVCEPRHWRQTIPYFLYLVNIRGKQWQKTIFRKYIHPLLRKEQWDELRDFVISWGQMIQAMRQMYQATRSPIEYFSEAARSSTRWEIQIEEQLAIAVQSKWGQHIALHLIDLLEQQSRPIRLQSYVGDSLHNSIYCSSDQELMGKQCMYEAVKNGHEEVVLQLVQLLTRKGIRLKVTPSTILAYNTNTRMYKSLLAYEPLFVGQFLRWKELDIIRKLIRFRTAPVQHFMLLLDQSSIPEMNVYPQSHPCGMIMENEAVFEKVWEEPWVSLALAEVILMSACKEAPLSSWRRVVQYPGLDVNLPRESPHGIVTPLSHRVRAGGYQSVEALLEHPDLDLSLPQYNDGNELLAIVSSGPLEPSERYFNTMLDLGLSFDLSIEEMLSEHYRTILARRMRGPKSAASAVVLEQ